MNESLGERSAHGALITLAANVARRGASLVARVVLARLLTPADFGLAALALFVVNIASQFQDAGFGAALVYYRDRLSERAGTSMWTTAALGALLCAVCLVLAAPVGAAFGEPRAAPLIMALGGMLFFNALAVTPLALLRRDLRNTALAVVEVGSTMIGLSLGIILALQGAGAWSLVGGTVAQSVSYCFLAWGSRPGPVSLRWQRSLAREMFGYGGYVVASGLATLLVLTLDNALVQAWFGTEILGLYVMAYGLAGVVAGEVGGAVGAILFPALAGLRDDVPRLRAAFVRATKANGGVALPLCAATAVLGPIFVTQVLGRLWEPAIPLLLILTLFGALRACFSGTGALFQACGEPQTKFRLDLLQVVCLVAIAFVLRGQGVRGVAWAVVGSAACTVGISFVRVERILGSGSVALVLGGLAGSAAAALLAGGAVYAGIEWGRGWAGWSEWFGLGAGAGLGALVYVGLLRIIAPSTYAELEYLRGTLWGRLVRRP